MALKSAKSIFITPGLYIKSIRLSNDSTRLLLTIENASVIAVSGLIILKILSFGIVKETSREFLNCESALLAILCLFLPSNLKGSVNIPNTIPLKFSAASVKTLAAPDPSPPPKHAIKITIS